MQLLDGQPVYAATDLVGFLACSHRLALERAALAGLVHKPKRRDPAVELVAKRGEAHERRYLADLRAAGRTVAEIERLDDETVPRGSRLRSQAAATERAMRDGADVIYQATFFDGTWLGFADFLLRVETPSTLGGWSYEVADTKLARHAKASAILQVCSYVEQLTRVQGTEPRELHLVLGGSARETKSFAVSDFMAYYRKVKAEFEAAVTTGEQAFPVTATYPEPVEHCEVCAWVVDCKAQRRSDDDLSLVAGITTRQRRALKARGVRRRRQLGVLTVPMDPRLDGVSTDALNRVQQQARIQVEGEDEHAPKHELLDPEVDEDGALVPDRGFLVLPPPSDHDLFFDIEGDPFALDDGVEYLFGVLEPALEDPGRPGAPMFHEIWSRETDGEHTGDVTRAAERRAFEQLVDLLISRLDADPTMHVYHYAAYEKTALGKLAQRHATREEEVDRLLRGRVLVDLFRVVRQGIRASVESYSIKRLEGLYRFVREEDLKSAGSSIVAFEAWLDGGEAENGEVGDAILRSIAEYNRDDVVSNWKLRDWLEERRVDLAKKLNRELPRPRIQDEAEKAQPLTDAQQKVADLVAALTSRVPADPEARAEVDGAQATWLLAQLLDWHRRENKAFWWRFYELAGLTDEELVDQREPLGHIEFLDDLGVINKAGTRLQRFRFPLQDHGLKEGRSVINPETVEEDGTKLCGTVHALDEVDLIVTLKRTTGQLEQGMPKALIPYEYWPTGVIHASLMRTAEWVLAHGVDADGPRRAARDLLLRRPPRTVAAAPELVRAGEQPLEAAVRLGLELDHGTLAIQGPPGSGKTYTAARMIIALVRAGRKVGVTANSHKVIGLALDKIQEAAIELEYPVRIGQRHSGDEPPTCNVAEPLGSPAAAKAALASGAVDVVGGTAWLWSSENLQDSVDVLFVDEAGQFSLANTVAVAPAGKSLVLLGDPQQLDQPLQGSHPPGAERSALGHVLGDAPVIAEGQGLFLTNTWRMHPDITAYTSEVFYAGKLESEPTLERQHLDGADPIDGTGLRWLTVLHAGDATESVHEARAIADLIRGVLAAHTTWTDRKALTKPVVLDDFVIVAPYNAHVARISRVLAEAGLATEHVGTVDKFQGQEAPIAIYSMATSTPEEAPRGMEFLYSLNRLNVATSRAKGIAIVVASPELVRVVCHTPRQMRLANALCRFVEVAEDRGPPGAPPAPTQEPALAGASPTTGEQLSWLR